MTKEQMATAFDVANLVKKSGDLSLRATNSFVQFES